MTTGSQSEGAQIRPGEEDSTAPIRPLPFALAAILVGAVAGTGAVLLRLLIAFFHNLLFLGRLSLHYDAGLYPADSPWGPFVVLVPALGAAGVVLLARHVAPEVKGTGVPEVIEAIYCRACRMRALIAPAKLLASSLSIGSGASVGREGPMIQIGAVLGSVAGQRIPISTGQRETLMASGVAGAIAATFNTPFGGILFAIEVLTHEASVRTLIPIALSSVTATYLARLVFGAQPFFTLPQTSTSTVEATGGWALLLYAGLGLILGLAARELIRSVYGVGDLLNKLSTSYYVQHIGAMLLVGIVVYATRLALGRDYISGIGHAPLQDLLSGTRNSVVLLLFLAALKWLVTSLALGSGASGGIFSPAIYIGGSLGGAYAFLLQGLFPHLAIDPAAFVVAGMAGLLGSTTGAAVASIIMLFEMTLDFGLVVPLTATVAVSYAVRKALLRESIFSLALKREGKQVPESE
ncbi:MAG: chloride channel protein [Anaerolineae bacterium]